MFLACHTIIVTARPIPLISQPVSRVDLGYRGHGIKDGGTEVVLARAKRVLTPAKRKRQKRHNAIKPIISHLKNDRKVGPRSWPKGALGDRFNAMAMAIGFNLRKILKRIYFYLLKILFWLFNPIQYQQQNELFYGRLISGGITPPFRPDSMTGYSFWLKLQ